MNTKEFFDDLYRDFNERNIELVINNLAPNVEWANGMDGGFVYGHEGVREYWTRQFKSVSSQVTPVETIRDGDVVTITVHQVVHDIAGNLLDDAMVKHVFTLSDSRIVRFEIISQAN